MIFENLIFNLILSSNNIAYIPNLIKYQCPFDWHKGTQITQIRIINRITEFLQD